MSIKVGITGGIGSGKSYVARIFKALGVPFYNADSEAKELMNSSEAIKHALIETFGAKVYDAQGRLDRGYLSSMVFRDQEQLSRLNAIVHPAVIQHAVDWADAQAFPYSLKEAALLFESGSYKTLDYTILVTAPIDIRISRVMQRDSIDEKQVRDRIDKQMGDGEKRALADFEIVNDGQEPLLGQVWQLHQLFLTKAEKAL